MQILTAWVWGGNLDPAFLTFPGVLLPLDPGMHGRARDKGMCKGGRTHTLGSNPGLTHYQLMGGWLFSLFGTFIHKMGVIT